MVVAANAGVNIWIAMLVLAPLVVGVIWGGGGAVAHPLALRPDDRHPARDVGLSLLFIGLVTSIFGASTATTISPPLG